MASDKRITNPIFSKRLKELMKEKGYTQTMLIDYVKEKHGYNLSVKTISFWLNERAIPTKKYINSICSCFGVTEAYLMGKTNFRNNEILGKIINHFGVQNQALKLCEECGELEQAIAKLILEGTSEEKVNHVAEEIGDVLILIEQFKINFAIKNEQIDSWIQYKLQRTEQKYNLGEGE